MNLAPAVHLLRLRDEILHIAARTGGPDPDAALTAIRDRFHHTHPEQRPYVLLDILDELDATEHETRHLRREILTVAVGLT